MAESNITAARAAELLDYDRATGAFMWRPQPAGHIRATGYVELCLDGEKISAHRVAWLMEHGSWPVGMIDHINGDRHDNRIENLRDTTARVNAENQRRAKANNQARFLGVAWHKQRAKWQAEIHVNGKKKYLGIYATAEEAHAVYLEAKRRLHEGCTI